MEDCDKLAETVSTGFGMQLPALSHAPDWPETVHVMPSAEFLHEGAVLPLHEL